MLPLTSFSPPLYKFKFRLRFHWHPYLGRCEAVHVNEAVLFIKRRITDLIPSRPRWTRFTLLMRHSLPWLLFTYHNGWYQFRLIPFMPSKMSHITYCCLHRQHADKWVSSEIHIFGRKRPWCEFCKSLCHLITFPAVEVLNGMSYMQTTLFCEQIIYSTRIYQSILEKKDLWIANLISVNRKFCSWRHFAKWRHDAPSNIVCTDTSGLWLPV